MLSEWDRNLNITNTATYPVGRQQMSDNSCNIYKHYSEISNKEISLDILSSVCAGNYNLHLLLNKNSQWRTAGYTGNQQ